MIAMLVVIVACGAYIGVQNFEIKTMRLRISMCEKTVNELTVNNAILKDNNIVLKDNMKKLATASYSNYQTAAALLEERAKAQTAINNLAAITRKDREALDRVNGKLVEMLKDPKNDGPLAPILRELIRDIQRERDSK